MISMGWCSVNGVFGYVEVAKEEVWGEGVVGEALLDLCPEGGVCVW